MDNQTQNQTNSSTVPPIEQLEVLAQRAHQRIYEHECAKEEQEMLLTRLGLRGGSEATRKSSTLPAMSVATSKAKTLALSTKSATTKSPDPLFTLSSQHLERLRKTIQLERSRREEKKSGDRAVSLQVSTSSTQAIPPAQPAKRTSLPPIQPSPRRGETNNNHDQDNGVGSQEPEIPAGFFPLSLFDDRSFEGKSVKEWLASSVDSEGKVAAYSKWFATDGSYQWKPCHVVQYWENEDTFLIEWDDTKKTKVVTRLNLLFHGDDPTKFEQRIQTALQYRAIGENQLRKNVRLDLADLTVVPGLPDQWQTEILERIGRATAPAALVGALLDEVRDRFKRTNKRLEMEAAEDGANTPSPPPSPTTLNMESPKAISSPRIGTVAIPQRSFPSFRDYTLCMERSLTWGNQVVTQAVLQLWEGVQQVHSLKLLLSESEIPPACPLGEFVRLQTSQFRKSFGVVKSEVQSNLVDIVLRATNAESYTIASHAKDIRFKNLIILINLMLKDALRTAIYREAQEYTALFEKAAPPPSGTAAAPASNEPSQRRTPLLHVNMVVDDTGQLGFSPPLEQFSTQLPNVIRELVEQAQTLPAVEVATVDQRYFTDELGPLGWADGDSTINRLLGRVDAAVTRGLQQLAEYKAGLHYEAILATPREALEYHSLSEFKANVLKLQREVDAAVAGFVDTATVGGLFQVNGSAVRASLVEAGQSHRQRLLGQLRGEARTELHALLQRFREIQERLSRTPTTPVELAAQSEFVQQLSIELVTLQQRLHKVQKKYQVLEDFFYEVPPEEFAQQWELLGWPKQIKKLVNDIDNANQIERLRMIRELRTNQKQLEQKLYELAEAVAGLYQYGELEQAVAVGDKVRGLQQELEAARAQARQYSEAEALFEFERSNTTALVEQLCKEFEPLAALWTTASDWLLTHSRWLSSPFTSLNTDAMTRYLASALRTAARTAKLFKGRKPGPFAAASQLKAKLDDFKATMHLVAKLRHPGVRTRHWELIAKDVGFVLPANELDFTLGYVVQLQLHLHYDVIKKITDVAINEYTLETALDKMMADLRVCSFELAVVHDKPVAAAAPPAPSPTPNTPAGVTPPPTAATGSTYILTNTEQLSVLLEDQLVALQAMHSSPYIEAFLPRLKNWKTTLRHIQDVLEEWLQCQRHWLYLGPIFALEDISRRLPSEARKYSAVDATWRRLMKQVSLNAKVLLVCSQELLLPKLRDCNQLLDKIFKGLNLYLETKRARFPRFYFLSNEELVDILAKSVDPRAVQAHLHKCFENVVRLEFTEGLHVRSVVSSEGETLALAENVATTAQEVETWLAGVDRAIKESLRKALAKCLSAYDKATSRVKWVLGWPAQVALTANQIVFTQRVTKALLNRNLVELKNLKAKLVDQLELLATHVRNAGGGDELSRQTIASLLTMEVHNREVLTQLVAGEVGHPSEHAWAGQLRYYWEDDSCVVRLFHAALAYGYEYLGNTARLVTTPLTERVFRTLAMAVTQCLGGALVGPAAAGKTQTVKELSKAVAKMCIVYNCSPGVNYLSIAKFLKGLASVGAWVCFDEFNRMDVEVLSVVAQLIQTIQRACRERAEVFSFDGGKETDVALDRSCALFVTLNCQHEHPSHAADAQGKADLPDNLKALFRPVAMVLPDHQLICEVVLLSEGFVRTGELARKIVRCFSLASHVLSGQPQYDFGLRAMRTALTLAGQWRRKDPQASEESVVARVLRDLLVPRLVDEDVPLFMGILTDLFPGMALPALDNTQLQQAIQTTVDSLGLQPVPCFLTKCRQLYDMLCVRHGVVLVGDTYAGKTACYRVVAQTLALLGEPVGVVTLNPKAVSLDELYGACLPGSLDWSDGVLPALLRDLCSPPADLPALPPSSSSETAASPPPKRWWVVLDGPIDSQWIENLQTALDDNRLLCLPSGERIVIPSNVSFLFETTDLRRASPATVSRCGVVYMDRAALGWKPLIQSWVNRLSPELHLFVPLVEKLCADYVEDALDTVRKLFVEPVPTTDSGLVCNLLGLLECFLPYFVPEKRRVPSAGTRPRGPAQRPKEGDGDDELAEDEDDESTANARGSLSDPQLAATPASPAPPRLSDGEKQDIFEHLFVFSLVWSLGATTNVAGRQAFDHFLRERTKLLRLRRCFPTMGTVYDYYFDLERRAWTSWTDGLDGVKLEGRVPLLEAMVPTKETVQRAYLAKLLWHAGKPTLFYGESGVGKSTELHQLLKHELGPEYLSVAVSLTPTTTVGTLQEALEAKLERRRKNRYGAPPGKKLVFFLDNLDAPLAEPANAAACPALEFLRQLIDHGGWYDLKAKKTFKQVDDVQLAAAMRVTDHVSPRLLRHFHLVYCPEPDDAGLRRILAALLEAKLGPLLHETVRATVVDATVEVFRTVSTRLRPTPSKPHYQFNMRDLFKVVAGLTRLGDRLVVMGLDQAAEPKAVSPVDVAKLWLHECQRVFGDRLVSDEERRWFTVLLKGALGQHFKLEWGRLEVEGRRLLFAEYRLPGVYEEVTDMDHLVFSLRSQLALYNEKSERPMELVLFPEAVEHVVRIMRVLSQPAGNALLLGEPGSGKQSLVRLASFVAKHELCELEVKRGYTHEQWRDDLRKAVRQAGLLRQPVTLLVAEPLLALGDPVLDDLAVLAHEGFVPGLFANEDLEAIYGQLRAAWLADASADAVPLHPAVSSLDDDPAAPSDHPVPMTLPPRPAFRGRMLSLATARQPAFLFAGGNRSAAAPMAAASSASTEGDDTTGGPATATVSNEVLHAQFIRHVREHLHIAICLTSSGAHFRERLRKYPSLVVNSTVDWFSKWSSEALHSIAKQGLTLYKLVGNEAKVQQVSEVVVAMHMAAEKAATDFQAECRRPAYVTSQKYMELLATFHKFLAKRTAEIEGTIRRVKSGLDKLRDISTNVVALQTRLETTQPKLERTTAEMEQLMANLEDKRKEAEAAKAKLKEEEAACAQEEAEAKAIADSAEAQLADALPALEAAKRALGALNKKDLTEIKSFTNPPPGMNLVIEATCIMLGIKPRKVDRGGQKVDDYWSEARTLLNDPHFVQRLLDFNIQTLTEETVLKLKPYIANPAFTPSNVEKISLACRSLCSWVRAMENCYWVNKSVVPKRQKAEEAHEALKNTQKKVRDAKARLQGVEDTIEALAQDIRGAEQKKQALVDQIADCQVRLQRAERLLGGLSGESGRWQRQSAELDGQLATLLADTLLAAGCLVYMGPLSAPYRARLLADWLAKLRAVGLACAPDFALGHALSSDMPVKERLWRLCGLPHDSHSLENAIIAAEGLRYAIMIDPQGQAARWIHNMEKDNGLKVAQAHDSDLLSKLETCLSAGLPLLIEGAEPAVIDVATLEPVLARRVHVLDGVNVVRLGDKSVPFHEKFRLYLTCEHPNPYFPASLYAHVTIINFSITPLALQDQLLSTVVDYEREDLERKRAEMVNAVVSNQRQLKELEDKILYLLYNAQGDLLDDELLIETLAASKHTHGEITARLAEAERTEREIEETRKEYKPVAFRASVLYMCLGELAVLDHMYLFSLPWFLELYSASMANADPSPVLAQRVSNLCDHFTFSVYAHVWRAMMKKHRLALSFMLCVAILRGMSGVNQALLAFLIADPHLTVLPSAASSRPSTAVQAPSELSAGRKDPPPCPAWVSSEAWALLCLLAETVCPHPFAALVEELSVYAVNAATASYGAEEWQRWWSHPSPQSASLPGDWSQKLDALQRLALIKCGRPDVFIAAVQQFVEDHLGRKFLEPPPMDLAQLFDSVSRPTRPLLFLLSPGEDPTEEIYKFAAKKDMRKRIQSISLGQQQGPVAEKLIALAIDRGNWVVLQNCHLAESWLPTLERLVKDIPPDRVHHKFRLWLTSQPSPTFPAAILLRSYKLAMEPPEGVRANLVRSYLRLQEDSPAFSVPPEPGPTADAPPNPAPLSVPSSAASGLGVPPAHLAPTTPPPATGSDGGVRPPSAAAASSGMSRIRDPVAFTVWRRLLCGLLFFHGVVQERGKFGPLGWAVPYEFSQSDLLSSMGLLEDALAGYFAGLQSAAPSPPPPSSAPPPPSSSSSSFAAAGHAALESAAPSRGIGQGPQYDPIPSLLDMIGECVYGGRITNTADRRVLRQLLACFLPPKLLWPAAGPVYFLAGSNSPAAQLYCVPKEDTMAGYMEYILSLPRSDDPELFGLHPSAYLVVAKAEARSFFRAMAAVYPSLRVPRTPGTTSTADTAAAQPASEDIVAEMIEAILSQLAGYHYDMADIVKRHPVSHLSPHAVVLHREVASYQALMATMKGSLWELKAALQGLSPVTASTDALRRSLLSGTVPQRWRAVSFPSTRPLSAWLHELFLRLAFLDQWTRQSHASAPPDPTWLPGLFHPKAFLSAILQKYARDHAVPVDTLGFSFEIMDRVGTTKPSSSTITGGVTVVGLSLEGARWDHERRRLVEPVPNLQYDEMPPIVIRPTPIGGVPSSSSAGGDMSTPAEHYYSCPLYVTPERSGPLSSMGESETLLLYVPLPSDLPESHWVKRGTALLCFGLRVL